MYNLNVFDSISSKIWWRGLGACKNRKSFNVSNFASVSAKIWGGGTIAPNSNGPEQWLAWLEMEVEEDGDSQKTENEKGGAF